MAKVTGPPCRGKVGDSQTDPSIHPFCLSWDLNGHPDGNQDSSNRRPKAYTRHEWKENLSYKHLRPVKQLFTSSTASSRPSSYQMAPRTANAEPQHDVRFSYTSLSRLSSIPHLRVSLCILADANGIDRGRQVELKGMSVDDLKKTRQLGKKLAATYVAFLASKVLIRQIPRLPGHGLSRALHPICHTEDPSNKLNEVRSTIGFWLQNVLYLGVAFGHANMTNEQVLAKLMRVDFLVEFRFDFATKSTSHYLSVFVDPGNLKDRNRKDNGNRLQKKGRKQYNG
ncbi:hypothetical protein BKA70DRAFT_1234090 [Coprinopsis sp. MPI-PUGE-AT-0042]|nr:hypothetical protein BKA70DRAFT_1234090 [Coprinopsis sp. MPI-PUGE-AT-0042]